MRLKKTLTFVEPIPFVLPDGTSGEFRAEFTLPERKAVFVHMLGGDQLAGAPDDQWAQNALKEDRHLVRVLDLEIEDDDGQLLQGECLKRYVLDSLVFGVATARAYGAAAFRVLEKNSSASPSNSSAAPATPPQNASN